MEGAADTEIAARVRALVRDLGIGPAAAVGAVVPLTGGVASDIARVWVGDRTFCAKFALARLRVAADWQAPVHRSRAEYAWLATAGRIVPGAVPGVIGYSDRLQGFLMEDVAGPGVFQWKAGLLSGRSDGAEAAAVARALVAIHAAGAAPDFDRRDFDNAADFRALRTDPYLRATADVHPDLAPRLLTLADAIDAAADTLVHGDVSPKNILIRAGGPVLLDAECATMGDAAFDVAFCLNHLALKALHLPGRAAPLWAAMAAFHTSYRAGVTWESPATLEARVAGLLPALMLARIDGKSPVEYLDAGTQGRVRRIARALVATPPATIAGLIARLQETAP